MTSQHTTAENEAREKMAMESFDAGWDAAIEYTRQENARLREALERISNSEVTEDEGYYDWASRLVSIAQNALSTGKEAANDE